MFLAVLLVLSPRSAEGSVDIPLHHWTYEAIERLVAMGVIDRAMITPRPYSRKEAARYVARGIKRVRDNEVPLDGREAVAEPLLYRLMEEFRPELIDLGIVNGPPHLTSPPKGERKREQGDWFGLIRYGGRVTVEGDAFFVEQGTVRFRENRMGEYYANGEQVQADARGWIEFGDILALSARPKVVSNEKVLGIGANENDKNVWLQELNAKLSLFNIALEIGRGSLWWGPGYHGSLLVTDHAFPLDMARLRSDEPFRLPWVLDVLGDWKINSFWGQLERDRDFPRANVFGLRVSWLSFDWLELGVTRLTQFNGRGRGQSFPEAVFDAYDRFITSPNDPEFNEQVMVDARFRIPRIPYILPFPGGLQMYGELGSEDKWSKFPIPSRAAFLAGIYIPQVFASDTMDLRIEYADTDFTRRKTKDNLERVWYNHSLYTSGLRFRGFPLGHHMGTDAIDIFVRSTRYLTDDLVLGANFNWQERDRGQPVHERKRETAVDLTWWLTNNLQLTLNYTYQDIKNPGQITSINPFQEDFADGVTSNNHLFGTSLTYEF